MSLIKIRYKNIFYCIGIHAGFIFIIKTYKQNSYVNFEGSFLNLISIGVAFLIGAVNTLYLYPTYLGSTFQGLVIALLAISNIVQPFISFGTQHAVIRYYSKYSKKTKKDGLLTLSVLIPLIIIILFVPLFFA